MEVPPDVVMGTLSFKKHRVGSSLLVQWLRLGAFTAVTRVAPLAGELRSCEPQDIAKNKQTKKTLCKTLGEPVSFLESS